MDPSSTKAGATSSRRARWYRGLAGHTLADVPVVTPDGRRYLVRIRRSSVVDSPKLASDPLSTVVEGVLRNAATAGQTGWDIHVVEPASPFRAERKLFAQHVDAKAIVVDVAMAIYEALERGDELWSD